MRTWESWVAGALGIAVAFSLACRTDAPEISSAWNRLFVELPDGVEVLDQEPVGDDDRVALLIAAEADQTISGRQHGQPPLQLVFSLDVDGRGNVYVLDRSSFEVRVFDPAGRQVTSFGGHGRGAGQLSGPVSIAVTDGQVVVSDVVRSHFGVWTLDGQHVRDVLTPEAGIEELGALSDGGLMAKAPTDLATAVVISRYEISGEETRRFAILPSELPAGGFILSGPQFAGGRHGPVYVTHGEEYQVVAFTPAGDVLWALRAPWPRVPITEEIIGRGLDRTERVGRAAGANVSDRPGFEWPEALPAIANIEADGHGRLWVFPVADDSETAPFPVDVYSADGELVVSGLAPFRDWQAARGEYVYRAEEDPKTAEVQIVRYRLALPLS